MTQNLVSFLAPDEDALVAAVALLTRLLVEAVPAQIVGSGQYPRKGLYLFFKISSDSEIRFFKK